MCTVPSTFASRADTPSVIALRKLPPVPCA